MASLPDKNKPEPPEPFITKAMRWSAYPISAALGGVAAHISMRNSIFARLKKYGAFNEVAKEHEQDLAFLKTRPYHAVEDMSKVNKKYYKQINTVMREWGFRNTWDFFRGCHDTERLEAGLLFGTVAGIFIGVAIALTESKSLQQLFSKKEKDENAQRAA